MRVFGETDYPTCRSIQQGLHLLYEAPVVIGVYFNELKKVLKQCDSLKNQTTNNKYIHKNPLAPFKNSIRSKGKVPSGCILLHWSGAWEGVESGGLLGAGNEILVSDVTLTHYIGSHYKLP